MTENDADQTIRDLAAEVLARKTAAVIVPRIAVSLAGWTPDPNDCHDNAARYVAANAAYRAAPGWQIMDIPALGLPYVDVIAHSVAEDGGGNLFDITPVAPLLALVQIPFLRHWGTPAEFEGLRATYQLGIIRVYSSADRITVLSW